MYFCAAEHPNPEIANNRVINMKQQQLDQVDSQITALQDVPTVNLRIWDLGSGLAGHCQQSSVCRNRHHSIKIIGSLGSEAIAAVTTGHRIFFGVQTVLMALSAGTTAMVARAWGAENFVEAGKVTSASLWLGNLVAVALTLPCLFFSEAIAGVFGLNADTTASAAEFIRMLSIFNIAFAVNMVLGAALRASGDTKTPLWIGAITNIINVILVYLLVFGLYGFPEMGVAGAALANGLSFTCSAIILLALWYGKKSGYQLAARVL